MSPGATFERVYRALKEQLGSGRFAAGEQLEPANLSHDLNASITPVRDALHRLTGEGLVETPRGDGFRTPLATEVALRHLYRWHATLIELALKSQSPPEPASPPFPGSSAGPVERAEAWFEAIAARSGNPEHVAALVRAGERLRSARRVELALLADWEAELDALMRMPASGELRRALTSYHRRRERLAPEIVAALHGPR
jgi:DNA-binding transcriptional MocR family regulator